MITFLICFGVVGGILFIGYLLLSFIWEIICEIFDGIYDMFRG